MNTKFASVTLNDVTCFSFYTARVRDESDRDTDFNGRRRPVTYDPKWQRTFKWIKASHLGDNCAYCTLCEE